MHRSHKFQHQTAFLADEAVRLFDAGDLVQARKVLNRCLRRDPDHVGALELQARLQWRCGELEHLLSTLSRLLELNPYEPGYHYLRGSALQCQGRFGEALTSYARCKHMGSSAHAKDAEEAIEALRECQLQALGQLLRDDLVFRSHYAQDPQAACAMVGIELREEPSQKIVYPSAEASMAMAWSRPS